MTFPRPIPESYWVIPGQFLAGEYPGNSDESKARRRISAFIEAGFTDFIDLTHSHELAPYQMVLNELAQAYGIEVSYRRIPVEDYSVPPQETMQSILDSIDQALANGRKVYLHCWGGVGRTGTAVGCYLVRHGISGDQALRQIAQWWLGMPKRLYHPHSPESEEQYKYILNWKDDPHPGRNGEKE